MTIWQKIKVGFMVILDSFFGSKESEGPDFEDFFEQINEKSNVDETFNVRLLRDDAKSDWRYWAISFPAGDEYVLKEKNKGKKEDNSFNPQQGMTTIESYGRMENGRPVQQLYLVVNDVKMLITSRKPNNRQLQIAESFDPDNGDKAVQAKDALDNLEQEFTRVSEMEEDGTEFVYCNVDKGFR